MKKTLLFVGLGNPEGKYFNTYHNLGFWAAECLAKNLDLEFKKKGNQLLAKGPHLILKPLTYMNLSGQAVLAVCRKHKIQPENVVVFMDDLYIDKGKIRITNGGSGGGHNGIRSITELLGTSAYTKIRIGIKPEKEVHSNAHYVLSKIENKELFQTVIDDAVRAAVMMTGDKPLTEIQQEFNSKND